MQGEASPCIFTHPSRGIACIVHADDFTSAGEKRGLEWLESMLEARYELRKDGCLGPGDGGVEEFTDLNSILHWTPEGFEYEADPRQGEKPIEAMRLDVNCNVAATPRIKSLFEQLKKDVELPPGSRTDFRGLARAPTTCLRTGSTCSSRRRLSTWSSSSASCHSQP